MPSLKWWNVCVAESSSFVALWWLSSKTQFLQIFRAKNSKPRFSEAISGVNVDYAWFLVCGKMYAHAVCACTIACGCCGGYILYSNHTPCGWFLPRPPHADKRQCDRSDWWLMSSLRSHNLQLNLLSWARRLSVVSCDYYETARCGNVDRLHNVLKPDIDVAI